MSALLALLAAVLLVSCPCPAAADAQDAAVLFDMPGLKASYEPAVINAFTEISEKIKQEG